jgi:hypothetical protein
MNPRRPFLGGDSLDLDQFLTLRKENNWGRFRVNTPKVILVSPNKKLFIHAKITGLWHWN